MRALVIGGSGYIGTRVTSALARRGWQVTVFALTPGTSAEACRFVEGDRRNPADLRRLSEVGDHDAVIDLAAYDARHTQAMIDLWSGRTGRLVHLSTVSVYRRVLAPAASEEMTERWPAGEVGYGPGKADCERRLEEAWASSGFRSLILRAAPIMGPGDPVSRENYFLKRILAGHPVTHPAPITGFISLLYVHDLVDAVLRSLVVEEPTCLAYHLAQTEPVTLAQHVAAIGRLVGRADVGVEELPLAALAASGLRLCGFPFGSPPRQRLACDRAVAKLGFSPTPYEEALERTVRSFADDPQAWPAWPGRGSKQSRLCGSHEWLHADQERVLRTGIPPVRLSRLDEVLEWLSGVHARDDGPLVIPPTSWRHLATARSAGPVGGSPSTATALVVPTPVIERLSPPVSLPGSADGKSRLPVDSSRLAAVIEASPEDGTGERGWLYGQTRPEDILAYRDGSVLGVRFARFRDIESDAVPEGERIVVTLCDELDARTFTEWLVACDERGSVEVLSLASYARVFLTHVCRWLPARGEAHVKIRSAGGDTVPMCPCAEYRDESERQPCRHLPAFLAAAYTELRQRGPEVGVWASVHDLARLLWHSEAETAHGPTILRVSTIHRPLLPLPHLEPRERRDQFFRLSSALLLFAAGDRAFVADLPRGRLLELSPSLVAVLEIARRVVDQRAVVPVLQEVLGLDRAGAEDLGSAGLRRLAEQGVLERDRSSAVGVAGLTRGDP